MPPYLVKHKSRSGKGFYARRIQRAFRRKRKRTSLAKQVRILKKKVNADTDNRWHDSFYLATSIPNTGVFLDVGNLANIPAGDAYNQRQGNKITLKSINISFNFLPRDQYNRFRVIGFMIGQQTLGAPALNDILQDITGTGATAPNVDSPYKKDSKLKYKILFDDRFTLQPRVYTTIPAGTVYTGAALAPNKWWRKKITFGKAGKAIYYKDGTASQPILNMIYLLFLSDSNNPIHPSYQGWVRTSWVA